MAAKQKKSRNVGKGATRKTASTRAAGKRSKSPRHGASSRATIKASEAGEVAQLVGQLKEPKSPMPAQHQRKPGLESKLDPLPRYQAPHYKGAGKLNNKVALITGGDSGIGRAVAVLFAREGADVAFTYLPVEESDANETMRAVEEEGRTTLSISGDIQD
ncbi:MAG TPA: SDR family NAD(P)-dependent oxidoreductase, partial [Pyrinomonadaceae bacterium]|nr:SDR family NAD(P)-dependent oxidoreductase [Pyrinomonadaceae bacterium]